LGSHLLQSHDRQGVAWSKARGSCRRKPVRGHRASAYALKGDSERAAAELAEARRLSAGNLFTSIAHLKAYPNAPKIHALYEGTYFAGLRKAGMPEE
jgi:hypothetical protein